MCTAGGGGDVLAPWGLQYCPRCTVSVPTRLSNVCKDPLIRGKMRTADHPKLTNSTLSLDNLSKRDSLLDYYRDEMVMGVEWFNFSVLFSLS